MFGRLAVAFLLLVGAPPATAHADWLITPFLGTSFKPETSLLTFDEGAGSKLTLGAAVTLLTDGIFGLEAEVAHISRFFEGDDPLGLVLMSRVTTVSGDVIVAAPLALTRESLRPYFAGGLGLIQARSKDAADFLPVNEDLLGLNLGAGVIGFVTDQAGLRFDLRHFRAISGADDPTAPSGITPLSFWRVTAGVTIRY